MITHHSHLITEMWQGINLIRTFNPAVMSAWRQHMDKGKILLTGEGSSRIFPAYNMMAYAKKINAPLQIETMGAREASCYAWHDRFILAASNSGKTKETIAFLSLCQTENIQTYVLTANADTPITHIASAHHLLSGTPEKAVAATQSVIEQALCYQALLGGSEWPAQNTAADLCATIMQSTIDPLLIKRLMSAQHLYWCGPKDGVCEELALKTIEILRKPSFYLEGTLALHGIEEILSPEDVIIIYHPHADDIPLYHKYLAHNIGTQIIFISHHPQKLPSIIVPHCAGFDGYLGLVQGWKLLAEAGLQLGVDLDKPKRARKVGNALDDTGAHKL